MKSISRLTTKLGLHGYGECLALWKQLEFSCYYMSFVNMVMTVSQRSECMRSSTLRNFGSAHQIEKMLWHIGCMRDATFVVSFPKLPSLILFHSLASLSYVDVLNMFGLQHLGTLPRLVSHANQISTPCFGEFFDNENPRNLNCVNA